MKQNNVSSREISAERMLRKRHRKINTPTVGLGVGAGEGRGDGLGVGCGVGLGVGLKVGRGVGL